MSKNEQARDKNGHFAQKNPDCEVATKAYVKYLFRKNVNHRHAFSIVPGKISNTACGAILGILTTMALIMIGSSPNTGMSICLQIVPFTIIFTIICILVASDIEKPSITDYAELDSDTECENKKYTPPECEEEEY